MRPLFELLDAATDGQKAKFVWRNGQRFVTLNQSHGAGKAQTAECDVYVWEAPDGLRVLVGLAIPCPHCQFPILVTPDQRSVGIDDGRLTLRQVLQCPARWRVIDDHGNVRMDRSGRPQIKRCGWAAVIVDGRAHNPKCPALSDQACRCGQDITPMEAAMISSGRG